MRLDWRHAGMVMLFAVMALATLGCTETRRERFTECRSANILFGPDRATGLATQLARSDWPATETHLEGPETTAYVEYYSDYFGPHGDERLYPQRWFQSYRVGSRYR